MHGAEVGEEAVDDADLRKFFTEKAAVESRVVSDEHGSVEAFQKLRRDLSKTRSVRHHRIRDAVHPRAVNRPVWMHKCVPLVERSTGRVAPYGCEFDDSVAAR
jgi:hypothetical protein